MGNGALPDNFILENIKVEVQQSSDLGLTQPEPPVIDVKRAEPHVSIGDIDWHRASIGGVFRRVAYGRLDNQPACHIVLDITFKSNASFRLETADLYCRISSDIETSKKPSIALIRPEQLPDPNPIGTMPRTHANVTAKGDVWLGLGKLESEIQLGTSGTPRLDGFDFNGSVTSTPGTTARDRATWNYKANQHQDFNLSHTFQAELIVLHDRRDFWIQFIFEGQLYMGTVIGWIGKNRKEPVHCKRTFHPSEHAGNEWSRTTT